MKRTSIAVLLLLVCVVWLGCGKKITEPTVEIVTDKNLGPIDFDEFKPVTNQTEQQQILQSIWQQISTPNCWGARPNLIPQYWFAEPYRYQYTAGISGIEDVRRGQVRFDAIGKYKDRLAAVIHTWYTRPILLILDKDGTMIMAERYTETYLGVSVYQKTSSCL